MHQESSTQAPAGRIWTAFLLACIAVAGSLYLSMGMGLKACPLCFYQRSFAMGTAAVLLLGLFSGRGHRGMALSFVVPMVVGGLGVAAFHVSLEFNGKLECPSGVLGFGSAPMQSLAIYIALTLAVAEGILQVRRSGERVVLNSLFGVVLGALIAWGSIASSPPLPPTPTKAYEGAPDTCRPPYRGE
jgi:hypothetical protein